MAPKVRRTANDKAKTKAHAKPKAKAALTLRPLSRPIWQCVELDAVYVSKVNKVPATFLDISHRAVNKFDMFGADMANLFTPIQRSGMATYPVVHLTVRIPANAIARREVETNECNGVIVAVQIDAVRTVEQFIVVDLCLMCGYPLF